MIVLELRRDIRTPTESVGVITIAAAKFQTIERPWVPNSHGGKGGEKFISCVPPGVYRLERFTRPSGEKAFLLSNPALDVYRLPQDVPAGKELMCRTLCEIHAANYVYEVNGCIGPGLERMKIGGAWSVTKSRQAMQMLRTLVGSDLDLKLRIEDVNNEYT